MIKINLLNEPQGQAARERAGEPDSASAKMVKAPKSRSASSASKGACLPIVGILVFLLFAAAGGAYYFWIDRSLKTQRQLNVSLTDEKKLLEPFVGQAEQVGAQYEAQSKKEESLLRAKKQQQLPVYFWTELEHSVPEKVFLLRLSQKGQKVEIRGESLTEDAIYQFRDALDSRSQWFSHVNLGSQMRRGNILEFGISLDLVNP